MLKKRVLALFLVVVMVLGMVPVGAFAVDTQEPTTLDGRAFTLEANCGAVVDDKQVFGAQIGYTLFIEAREDEIPFVEPELPEEPELLEEGESELEPVVPAAPEAPAVGLSVEGDKLSVGVPVGVFKETGWEYAIVVQNDGAQEIHDAVLTVKVGSDTVTRKFDVDLIAPVIMEKAEWSEVKGTGSEAVVKAEVLVKDYLPVELSAWAKTNGQDVAYSREVLGDGSQLFTFEFKGQGLHELEYKAIDVVGNATEEICMEDLIVDTDAPTVSGFAYISGEMAHVEIKYGAGLKGIEAVKIGEHAVEDPDSSNTCSVDLEGYKVGSEIPVSVKAGNGLFTTTNLIVTDDLVAKIDYNALGSADSDLYVNDGDKITLSVHNSIGAPTISVKNTNGEDIALDPIDEQGKTWNLVDGVYTATITVKKDAPVEGVYLSVTDEARRTAEDKVPGTFIVDAANPVITVSALPRDGYYNEGFAVTVTVTDDTLINEKDIRLETNIQGMKTLTAVENGWQITFDVTDGQKLEDLKVYAKDITGKEAEAYEVEGRSIVVDQTKPVVTVEASENVIGFVTNNNKTYAIIENAVSMNGKDVTGVAETVSFTVTVSDANLNTGLYAEKEGWVVNDAKTEAKKTFTLDAEVHKEDTYVYIAVNTGDLAGWKADADVAVTGKGLTEGGTGCTISCNDFGGYTQALYVDRLVPNSGLVDGLPTMSIVPNDTNGSEKVHTKDDFKYLVKLADNGTGIKDVYYTLTDSNGAIVETKNETKLTYDNGYWVEVKTVEGAETDAALLRVVATDRAGNSFTFTHTFSVDRKAPELTLTPNPTGDMFLNGVTYNLSVSDMFQSNDAQWSLNDGHGGSYLEMTGTNEEATISVLPDVTKETTNAKLSVSVTDVNGNKGTASVTFTVDNQKPRITATFKDTKDCVEYDMCYFQGERELTLSVTDATLDIVTVTVNETAYPYTEGLKIDFVDDGKYDVEVKATDKLGNTTSWRTNFVIDNTKAVATVEKKGAAFVQCQDGVDYFAQKISYDITIADTNLADATAYYIANGEKKDVKLNAGVGSFEVDFGDVVTDIVIYGKDKAGNFIGNVTAIDPDAATNTDKTPLKFEFNTTDYAWHMTSNAICIDNTPPAVTVEITGNKIQTSDRNIDYYNGEVAYSFKITEQNLKSAQLFYTLEDAEKGAVEKEVKIDGGSENPELYTAKFTLTNGQVMTGMRFIIVDNANNVVESVTQGTENVVVPFVYDTKNEAGNRGQWTYSGNTVVVDTTAPAVTVTKINSGKYVQTYNNVDYYDGEVKYQFTVSDQFMDFAEYELDVQVTYEGSDEEGSDKPVHVFNWVCPNDGTPHNTLNDVDKYVGSFTVKDGKVVEKIVVTAKDGAGNTLKGVEVAVTDADNKTDFEAEKDNEDALTGNQVYKGNKVCVDMTAPVVEVDFTSDEVVESYYYHNKGDSSGYKYFVRLAEKSIAESGTRDDELRSVTMTVKVTDTNVTNDENSAYELVNNLDDNINWVKVSNTEYTYTKTVEVKGDNSRQIEFDLSVFDLAGNPAEQVNVVKKGDTSLPEEFGNIENGRIKDYITIDCRRPSTGADTDLPNIMIFDYADIYYDTPSNFVGVINNGQDDASEGVDLYRGSVDFIVAVQDNDSGLAKVTWNIVEADALVEEKNRSKTYDYTAENIKNRNDTDCDGFSHEFILPVNVTTEGESNDVEIRISAEDNVGNMITYVKEIALDNKAPVVNVHYNTYDDQDIISRSPYFKADRTATITVTDLNLDITNVTATKNGADWGYTINEANKSYTISYNVDGDYEFFMDSKDLAGNIVTLKDDAETVVSTYNASAANHIVFDNAYEKFDQGGTGDERNSRYKFTIDKTLPVIQVTYTPATPVGQDEQGVEYYDTNRTATSVILDMNFETATYTDEVNGTTATWNPGNGTRPHPTTNIPTLYHSFSKVYTEGNNYRVQITNATDKAGNVAEHYSGKIFSVDLTAPTIEITKGTMTNQSLNIVQDALELGFTINDAQDNLDNFYVTMKHLNGQFQMVEVSGSEYFTVTDADDRTTGYVDITNLAKTKAMDGIYSIQVTATDYAKHTVSLTPELYISVNRFGSTFMITDAYTKEFLSSQNGVQIFRNAVAQDLVILEINPNKVTQSADSAQIGSLITLAFNGNAIEMVPDSNYTVTEIREGAGENAWYVYEYRILKDNFYNADKLVDGRYKLLFYSEDQAGNKNANETNQGSVLTSYTDGSGIGTAEFILDNQKPVISIIGLATGDRISADFKTVEINVTDNTAVSIAVYVNGKAIELVEYSEDLASNKVWLAYDATAGKYLLNICEYTDRQDIRVVALDAAGNEIESNVEQILLTSNWFIQYVNNIPALCITALVVIAAGVLIVILIKKKKQD